MGEPADDHPYHPGSTYSKTFRIEYDEMPLIYDVAHNVAKFEEHLVDGKNMKVCVHRKGATRSLGRGLLIFLPTSPLSGSRDNSRQHGNIFLYPPRNPYCHGTDVWEHLPWCGKDSISRTQAKKMKSGKEIVADLKKQNIMVRAHSEHAIADEAPDVYKSSEDVVNVVHEVGLSRLVARLSPIGVIKG